MRHYSLIASLAVLLFSAVASAVDPSDLKPGLATTYLDAPNGVRRVARLEPTVALVLAKGETPHPRLDNGAAVEWSGYVNILRPGKYRFDAIVEGGQIHVKLNGHTVLTATGNASGSADVKTDEIVLDGGLQLLQAEFL